MEYMATLPDKAFDLAIVDPPYGIGEDGGKCRTRGSKKTNGEKRGWDNERPEREYFAELQRISSNQIIWGGNYFADLLPATRCWLYWQKDMGGDFADGELAWTSFDKVLKQFKKRSETFDRIHPTQKPVKLYEWLLTNYAKPGQRILDTHLGSMSSVIASNNLGFEMVGCELDEDYYASGCERAKNALRQVRMFD
jgi:site-specific DNA-methyltransferase (adenine-specific)